MNQDSEELLCKSWSIGRLRPWLQMIAEREMTGGLRGHVDASDIVQETLLKAWKGESQFAGSTLEQRLAWLRMIVKNTIRDHQRRLGADKRGAGRARTAVDTFSPCDLGLSAHALAQEATGISELIAAEEALALMEAMKQLPLEQRRVIELRHFEGQSHSEIAARLNKTEPATRMLWVRALRTLQQLIVNGKSVSSMEARENPESA